MLGIVLLLGYLLCGCALMDALLPRRNRLIRLWLGLCCGLILMMWLPTLYAFFIDFTLTAQLLGLATCAVPAALGLFAARRIPRERAFTDMPLWLPLALIVPLALLGGYLQYTHTLRQAEGALYVGQSTYGDLCLHLGIATSLRNAAYPPDYSLLPGALLGYPFLGDSMVTTMLLGGTPLSLAFRITGTLMLALVFTGFTLFAWELTHSAAATALAYALMFVNGGLGFLYAFDGIGRDASAFKAIFTGFYATPTNQPALNLRWVNVICDMMIPQRTLLTGWMALLPALWLLVTAVREGDPRRFVILGVWGGAMPMIHTHSFLALGLISVAAVVYVTWKAPAGARLKAFLPFLAYGLIAVALAAPQLLKWSVPQTVNGGSLGFRFNWVNNRGDGRLIDGYCWFWIKNVGLIWLLMIPAALSGPREKDSGLSLSRMLGLGALLIYVVAELIQFQPNEYDNNKLFYVAYMAMMPAMGMYLTGLWRRLKGVRGRALIAAAFLFASTVSGALSIGREVVSNYRLFSRAEAEAAAFIDENTPGHAVFLTGSQHNNAVAALAGRNIVCGTGSYLYFHGMDYARQQADERRMLEAPEENRALFEQYGVEYAYISSYERANFAVDEEWFRENGELIFLEGDVAVYRLFAQSKT